MLVQFKVKNVFSFKEEAVLDMTAINAYKEHPSNLIDIGRTEKYVKVAAVYGANASGKSNLFNAFFLFQRIVTDSFNTVKNRKRKAIEQRYFPFSFEDKEENSEFSVALIIGDFEYRYGFEYNRKIIVAEWMYRVNLSTNRTSVIFERMSKGFEFGASVRRECNIYRDQIPADSLALSFLSNLKLKTTVFNDLYNSIDDIAVAPAYVDENNDFIRDYLPTLIKREHENLTNFLTAIDTGIKDIECDESEKPPKFYTWHKGKDGKDYRLSLSKESGGTIQSIMLYILVTVAIKTSSPIFIDELNLKLHPLLLKFIIDLFYDENSEAQLIYTTHDTTLLDKRFFRRDQIWFVEKDKFGYSELVALSDYKVRSDASFEKDYLAGVYGGIPFLKDLKLKEGK